MLQMLELRQYEWVFIKLFADPIAALRAVLLDDVRWSTPYSDMRAPCTWAQPESFMIPQTISGLLLSLAR